MFGFKKPPAPDTVAEWTAALRQAQQIQEYWAARGVEVQVDVRAVQGKDGRTVYEHRSNIDIKDWRP